MKGLYRVPSITFAALIAAMGMTTQDAHAQLHNLDFESWTTDSISAQVHPDAWSFYSTSLSSDQNGYCYQVTPAQQGDYALGVSVWYYYVKSQAVQKAAYAARPTALDGYYTYTENTVHSLLTNDTLSDTALVSILLTRWNDATLRADTVGYGILPLFASGDYSPFSCPVTYASAAFPDSITIVLDPSIVRRYVDITDFQALSAEGTCSYLTIDALSLQTPTGQVELQADPGFAVYPNPSSGAFTVIHRGSTRTQLAVFNAVGERVYETRATGPRTTIDLSGHPKGIYVMRETGPNGNAQSKRFILQ